MLVSPVIQRAHLNMTHGANYSGRVLPMASGGTRRVRSMSLMGTPNGKPNGHVTPCDQFPLRSIPCLREFAPDELDFVKRFKTIGAVEVLPAKTMIGIATSRKRIAYVTLLGKNFIHVVLPFQRAYQDNLCFQKIAQVPGDVMQFNHHLRLYSKDDLTDEVYKFMKLAFDEGI